MHATAFSIAAAIAAIPDPRAPRMVGDLAAQGGAMVGVIRIAAGRPRGWERHDGGDELLVVVAGRFTMALRPAGAAEQHHDLGPGDTLLIPRGVAHSGVLHTPEIQLLFVTPREGTVEWTEPPARA
jgi:quercetin dioxygenase-like cupin family protein